MLLKKKTAELVVRCDSIHVVQKQRGCGAEVAMAKIEHKGT